MFGTTHDWGTDWGQVRAADPLPRQSTTAKSSVVSTQAETFAAPAPPQMQHYPPTLPWSSRELSVSEESLAPSNWRVHGSVWTCSTSVSTIRQTVVQSLTLLHDQQSSIPMWQYRQLLQHQESILPDTKCYFTPAAKHSDTSSTKESIWFLRTKIVAGLFQVSFGSC